MKCPVDGEILTISERSGIEIDYCPQCRGVWLDRGELDKLIDRATPYDAMPSRPTDSKRHYEGDNSGYNPKKRKESFLGDLFDF